MSPSSSLTGLVLSGTPPFGLLWLLSTPIAQQWVTWTWKLQEKWITGLPPPPLHAPFTNETRAGPAPGFLLSLPVQGTRQGRLKMRHCSIPSSPLKGRALRLLPGRKGEPLEPLCCSIRSELIRTQPSAWVRGILAILRLTLNAEAPLWGSNLSLADPDTVHSR